VGQLGVEA
jgi:hypothetical protein